MRRSVKVGLAVLGIVAIAVVIPASWMPTVLDVTISGGGVDIVYHPSAVDEIVTSLAVGETNRSPDSRTSGTTKERTPTPAEPTTTPAATETPTRTSTPEQRLERQEVERLVHGFVNAERSDRGLSTLSYDSELVEIARYHSEDMADRGYFSHDSPEGNTFSDRYDRFGYDCRVPAGGNQYYTGGENILFTYYEEPIEGGIFYETPEELAKGVVAQWMDSPSHRENILKSEWRREGIGVSIEETPEGTRVYVTQNFC